MALTPGYVNVPIRQEGRDAIKRLAVLFTPRLGYLPTYKDVLLEAERLCREAIQNGTASEPPTPDAEPISLAFD